MAEKDDLLRQALEDFRACEDAENHNRLTAIESIRFARLGEQWPEAIRAQRQREGRPVLTINKLPTFIRQVVNDARQNKPAIQIHASDNFADPETAQVFAGLIRNIEYQSNADTAYDTATDCAVSGGFGYFRIVTDYAYNDAADLDILIKRIANPFSVYADPNSVEADSSDWDVSFVTNRLTKSQFKKQWGDKAEVSWDDTSWKEWRQLEYNTVTVAEWWTREEAERPLYATADGLVLDEKTLQSQEAQFQLQAGMLQITRKFTGRTHKVKQTFCTGAEVLEEKEWAGCYIPIVPVYGDEFDVEGQRYLRSLVHNSIDSQRLFNYARSTGAEVYALTPRVPWIGKKGTFNSDNSRWQTANTKNHAYLEYDGEPPQRMPLDMGPAVGAMQEALTANEDMKATMGLFDASLGQKSNETSGRAIMARQHEGDVSTFHFIDNMARSIRHAGKILIDLIPKVYSTERMVRILGEDGEQNTAKIGPDRVPEMQPVMGEDGQPVVGPDGKPQMQPVMRPDGKPKIAVHSLNVGKYDLTVSTGPSFTSRREEAAMNMVELIRAYPPAAPVIGPELAKVQDWPGAKTIAQKLEAVASGQLPPEAQQQMEGMQQEIQRLTEENQQLKQDKSDKILEAQMDYDLKSKELVQKGELKVMELQLDQQSDFYKAQVNAQAQASRPVVQGKSASK